MEPTFNFQKGYIDHSQQISLAYIILTTILFLFPPNLSVSGSSMSKCRVCQLLVLWNSVIENCIDYCVAAFGIVFVVSSITWIVDGRKNYVGPRVEVEVLAGQAGERAAHSTSYVEQNKT